jgi:hypothetical protein
MMHGRRSTKYKGQCDMPLIIRLALALDLLAVWCEQAIPRTRALLPFGGNHFNQLAMMVLIASIIYEIFDIFKSANLKK